MTHSLKISQKLLNRLSTVTESYTGKVYGIQARKIVYLLSVEINSRDGSLVSSFPAEIDVRGIISIGDGNFDNRTIQKSLRDVYVTDNPVFISYEPKSGSLKAYFYCNDQLEECTFQAVNEQQILSQFLYVRLQGDLPFSTELSNDAIKENFLQLRKRAASGIMSFGFVKKNVILLANDDESGIVGVSGNPAIADIFEDANELSEGTNKKRKNQNVDISVVDMSIFKQVSGHDGTIADKKHAPICILDKKPGKTLFMTVSIDSLSMVHRQTKVDELYGILVESALRYLRLLETAILKALDRCESKKSKPETFHFYPPDYGHFITKIYLKSDSDEYLLSERQELHKLLMLDGQYPRFRRANAFDFQYGKDGNARLVNPHEGVKTSDNGGKVALVKGKYLYYHYCQDRMDDNGWGCAYRSLQTLASWFKIQGHTDKEVPTFTGIQKCLVDIGDKPKTFIDSKQWIGSTEVNFVLNTLLGVTCKILYVSSGEEMASKGPELVNHFETHGSPVMIGGGVLAHTILGVDYNSQSGGLKFLILDPHYTGAEDLHTIQSKGWCGWKGVDFWDKTAYYNMCLPQVPSGI